ncbi:hypothetical protein AURDEDRAFT_168047 [Auricularia subglabra TFB-10046 SS5]|nr:hypothetical protein AURDEDRAFT_168047 [Auricularia subglabra TFB-10046 SS5]
MPPPTSGHRALAPIFRISKIGSSNVTLPVELVLDIVKGASAQDARLARTLALVCRTVYSEVDRYRYRSLRWRRPQRLSSFMEMATRYDDVFLIENAQALFWDCSHQSLLRKDRKELTRCVHWLRNNPAIFRVSTLALNLRLVFQFQFLCKHAVLKELMIIYDPSRRGRTANMYVPYQNLTHLLLRNFPVGSWPIAVLGCKALTHLALDAVHAQDGASAQDAADAIMCFRIDAFEELPVLKLFLFILVDDGELPQFRNAEIYADAIWEPDDDRGRIDFDTIPCDWDKRWWRARTQDGGSRPGTDIWDSGSIVPLYTRHAQPPLSNFLN